MDNESQSAKKAFPIVDGNQVYDSGMTLRDYFAAKAMQALIAHSDGNLLGDERYKTTVLDSVSKKSYMIAEAMLKQREEGLVNGKYDLR